MMPVMKTLIFYQAVLHLTGLLCCYGQANENLFSSILSFKKPKNLFDNRNNSEHKTVLLISSNNYGNIHLWNSFANIFNMRNKAFEQVLSNPIPINQTIQSKFSSKKLKRSIEEDSSTVIDTTTQNNSDNSKAADTPTKIGTNPSTASSVHSAAIETTTQNISDNSKATDTSTKIEINLSTTPSVQSTTIGTTAKNNSDISKASDIPTKNGTNSNTTPSVHNVVFETTTQSDSDNSNTTDMETKIDINPSTTPRIHSTVIYTTTQKYSDNSKATPTKIDKNSSTTPSVHSTEIVTTTKANQNYVNDSAKTSIEYHSDQSHHIFCIPLTVAIILLLGILAITIVNVVITIYGRNCRSATYRVRIEQVDKKETSV